MQWLQENWVTIGVIVVLGVVLFKNIVLAKLIGVESIDAQTLHGKQQNSDSLVIVDVRTAAEFAAIRIPHSVHVPLTEIQRRLTELLQKHAENELAVICQSGNRSLMGSLVLKKAGFKTIYNVQGGLMAWKNQGLPVEQG